MRDSDFQYSIAVGDTMLDAFGEKQAVQNGLAYSKVAQRENLQSLWDSLDVDYDIGDD
jgi:hypothetical protein